jgi:hypothetical protein
LWRSMRRRRKRGRGTFLESGHGVVREQVDKHHGATASREDHLQRCVVSLGHDRLSHHLTTTRRLISGLQSRHTTGPFTEPTLPCTRLDPGLHYAQQQRPAGCIMSSRESLPPSSYLGHAAPEALGSARLRPGTARLERGLDVREFSGRRWLLNEIPRWKEGYSSSTCFMIPKSISLLVLRKALSDRYT